MSERLTACKLVWSPIFLDIKLRVFVEIISIIDVGNSIESDSSTTCLGSFKNFTATKDTRSRSIEGRKKNLFDLNYTNLPLLWVCPNKALTSLIVTPNTI